MHPMVIRTGRADLDFGGIRAEFGLPGGFTAAVLDEARAAAARGIGPEDREDATGLPFVTIDPPGAK
ncbi:MAG: RNB domain-containing ribonuclease, partial [Saccharothrix sp.]|nr:RNB domain-containing ribonuclease [Saccharothrix sp.]